VAPHANHSTNHNSEPNDDDDDDSRRTRINEQKQGTWELQVRTMRTTQKRTQYVVRLVKASHLARHHPK